VKVTGISLAATPTDLADITVVQYANGLTPGSALVYYLADQYTDFVPLHPLCTDIQVVNKGNANAAFVSVVFGIDG